MTPYKNLSGDSGVIAYEIRPRSILVRFRGGPVYNYSYKDPGREQVETMKELAKKGLGLSTYISRHVQSYESME